MKERKISKYKLSKGSEPEVLRDASAAGLGRVVTVRDAKAHLSKLLEWVSAGNEVTITSNGQPKAKLIGATIAKPRKVFEGMGDYLTKQRMHRQLSADEAINLDRGAW